MSVIRHGVVLLILSAIGCQEFDLQSLRSQSPEAEAEDFETKVETPMIGDYTTTAGRNMITLEGVGLVMGLAGTGGDPPISSYRTMLLKDMRKRGVRNPNQLLADPSTALVVIRAYLPPLIRKGETFDVDVRLPPGSSASSLEGGWLMETHLSERALVPGQGVMKGHILAKADGRILVSLRKSEDGESEGLVKRGRILAGGRSMTDRDLSMFVKSSFRSVRNSKRVADKIGERFFAYNKSGIREPLAEAKTDQKIELRLHPTYKENFPRYLQVIRSMAFRETEVARRVRMQNLEEQLGLPQSAEKAAIALEAIGSDAVPILKSGLKNEFLECRFHAAMALAYLGDAAGVPTLKEAARDEPAFRVFAFASMAAVDEADTHVALRELMDEETEEIRYGAFRALTTLDPNDPFVRGLRLNNEFTFHMVESEGPPMVHVTHRKKSELVLFGADQEFRRPLVLRAGKHILVTSAPGSQEITVSRYQIGQPDQRREVAPRISEVIRTVVEFGGSYPEVVSLLLQADKQRNLPGKLGIDSLPRIGRTYFRPDPNSPESKGQKAKIGSKHQAPNLFDLEQDEEGAESGSEELDPEEPENRPGSASAVDITDVESNVERELERLEREANPLQDPFSEIQGALSK